MGYMLIGLVTLLVVAGFEYFHILVATRRLVRSSLRSVSIMRSGGLTDEQKEKLLPIYSILMFRRSMTLAVFFGATLLLVAAADRLYAGFLPLLLSLPGIGLSCLVAFLCLPMIRRLRSRNMSDGR